MVTQTTQQTVYELRKCIATIHRTVFTSSMESYSIIQQLSENNNNGNSNNNNSK